MFKKLIVVILLSVLVVFFTHESQVLVDYIVSAHAWLSIQFGQVFSGGEAGNIARQLLTLLALPVIVGLIPSLLYWALRRHWFPYFMDIVAVVWLVQTTALLAQTKVL